jgi:hypothetical protein
MVARMQRGSGRRGAAEEGGTTIAAAARLHPGRGGSHH